MFPHTFHAHHVMSSSIHNNMVYGHHNHASVRSHENDESSIKRSKNIPDNKYDGIASRSKLESSDPVHYDFFPDKKFEAFHQYIILPAHNIIKGGESWEINIYLRFMKDYIVPRIEDPEVKEYVSKILDRYFSEHDFEISVNNAILGLRTLYNSI